MNDYTAYVTVEINRKTLVAERLSIKSAPPWCLTISNKWPVPALLLEVKGNSFQEARDDAIRILKATWMWEDLYEKLGVD